jgi:hypothetical protein
MAAAAAALLTLANIASTSRPAGADPAFTTAYTGVGSDTIQDLFDAFNGAEPYPPFTGASPSNPYAYTPLHSSAASGNKAIASFDAIPAGGTAASPGCIIAKLGGTNFDRPNGSSNGIHALSHAIDTNTANNSWVNGTASASCTGTPVNVAGQISFARSSRGPNVSGTVLTYIPVARDGLSYMYFHGSGGTADLTALPTTGTNSLQSLYNGGSGTMTIGADTVHACLPQSGSGTRNFFVGAIGVTDANANIAAVNAGCPHDASNSITMEENGGDAFVTWASTLGANQDAIIPFSTASWISQANGVALDRSSTARPGTTCGTTPCIDLGNPDSIGGAGAKPYTGTSAPFAPNATYYNFVAPTNPVGTYGRDTYVVVPTAKLGTFGDAGLKSLFLGSGSAVCSSANQATVHTFGFLTPSACGSSTLQGGLEETGASS